MAAKYHRSKKGMSLSWGEKRNYEGDIRDDMDLDQANDNYSLQL